MEFWEIGFLDWMIDWILGILEKWEIGENRNLGKKWNFLGKWNFGGKWEF